MGRIWAPPGLAKNVLNVVDDAGHIHQGFGAPSWSPARMEPLLGLQAADHASDCVTETLGLWWERSERSRQQGTHSSRRVTFKVWVDR